MPDNPNKVIRYQDGSIDFGRSNSCYISDEELRTPRQDKRLASGALTHRDQKAQMNTEEAQYRHSLSLERREDRAVARKIEQALTDRINGEAEVLAEKALRQMHRVLDKDEPSAAEIKVFLDHFLGTPKQKVEVTGDIALTPIVISRKVTPELTEPRVIDHEDQEA